MLYNCLKDDIDILKPKPIPGSISFVLSNKITKSRTYLPNKGIGHYQRIQRELFFSGDTDGKYTKIDEIDTITIKILTKI